MIGVIKYVHEYTTLNGGVRHGVAYAREPSRRAVRDSINFLDYFDTVRREPSGQAASYPVSLLFRLPSVASDAPQAAAAAAETNIKRHRPRVMTPHCSSTDFTLVAPRSADRRTPADQMTRRPTKTTPFPGWLTGCLAPLDSYTHGQAPAATAEASLTAKLSS